DPKEAVVCQLWFRKEVTANKATADQVKNGLSYRELDETTLLGAIQYPSEFTDYRKQKIKAGVYTLRLAFQPMDGDHMVVSAHQEFCLLVSAKLDGKPGEMDPKGLQELSTKSIGTSHPGVLMLFPYDKPQANPKLVSKANEHWVVNVKENVKVKDQKTAIGIGLTVVGHAE